MSKELTKRLRTEGDGVMSRREKSQIADMIEQLEAENATLRTDFAELRAKVFTNGDRSMTMDGRTFTVEGDGLIFDNNFDFDATLRVYGDFVDDQKRQYAQMIAEALNSHNASLKSTVRSAIAKGEK